MSGDGRQRVLDSAFRLFLEHGYAATTTQQIAEAAEVAKSLLHYHFQSKHALLLALVEPVLAEAEELLDELEGAGSDAEAVLRAHLAHVAAHRDGMRLLNNDISVALDPGVTARHQAVVARWRALVAFDEVHAAAVLGVLTRPLVHTEAEGLEERADELVGAALAALAAIEHVADDRGLANT